VRYDLSHAAGSHALRFGVDFIHEPVLGGAFASNTETLATLPNNPSYYTLNAITSHSSPSTWRRRGNHTGGNGGFSQTSNGSALCRDSWRVSHHFTVNYGLRYQTTSGFSGFRRKPGRQPSFILLPSLGYPEAVPHDDRKQIALASESPTRLAPERR